MFPYKDVPAGIFLVGNIPMTFLIGDVLYYSYGNTFDRNIPIVVSQARTEYSPDVSKRNTNRKDATIIDHIHHAI